MTVTTPVFGRVLACARSVGYWQKQQQQAPPRQRWLLAMARGLSRELSKQKNLKNQSGNKGRTDDMTPAQRAEQCAARGCSAVLPAERTRC